MVITRVFLTFQLPYSPFKLQYVVKINTKAHILSAWTCYFASVLITDPQTLLFTPETLQCIRGVCIIEAHWARSEPPCLLATSILDHLLTHMLI